ncbi:uncharacterized [Tachysurus ichikawai]
MSTFVNSTSTLLPIQRWTRQQLHGRERDMYCISKQAPLTRHTAPFQEFIKLEWLLSPRPLGKWEHLAVHKTRSVAGGQREEARALKASAM